MPQGAELLQAIQSGALSLAESAGITEDELQAIFALALSYLDSGRFPEAETLMAGLVVLYPFERNFWLVYARALEKQGKHELAAQAKKAAATLAPQVRLDEDFYAPAITQTYIRRGYTMEQDEIPTASGPGLSAAAPEAVTQTQHRATAIAVEPVTATAIVVRKGRPPTRKSAEKAPPSESPTGPREITLTAIVRRHAALYSRDEDE